MCETPQPMTGVLFLLKCLAMIAYLDYHNVASICY